jgi:hypothetical protein
MKFGLPGLPTMATLCLIVVLTCWLGIGGAVISEIKVQGFLQTMEKWQTLIGVGAALAVGYIAVRPVWRQVKIMGAQAALLHTRGSRRDRSRQRNYRTSSPLRRAAARHRRSNRIRQRQR